MCPKVVVDTGAIKHIIGGSDVMCRGMTSAGGKLDEDFAAGTVVVRDILPSMKCLKLYSSLTQ
jgi:predicted ribosome-associated RNA-binding protein Tma20